MDANARDSIGGRADKPGGGSVSLPVLLSVKQVAQSLGVSRSKVYELIASHELEAFRPGGRIRIPTRAVAELLERTRL